MPFGTEVNLAHATLCRSFPLKGAQPPIFGSCLLWPNVWMDEDSTWYGSRSRPSPHCIRRTAPNCPRLSTSGMSHACLYSPVTERYHTLPGTVLPISPGRLDEILVLRWFTVTHTSTNRAQHGVTSLIFPAASPLHQTFTPLMTVIRDAVWFVHRFVLWDCWIRLDYHNK